MDIYRTEIGFRVKVKKGSYLDPIEYSYVYFKNTATDVLNLKSLELVVF